MAHDEMLPEGWTSEHFQTRLPHGVLLEPQGHFVVEIRGGDFRELVVDCLVRVHASQRLCLAREANTQEWYVGDLDVADRSVECWARCGSTLDEAVDSI
jgi:hypothetical protein